MERHDLTMIKLVTPTQCDTITVLLQSEASNANLSLRKYPVSVSE